MLIFNPETNYRLLPLYKGLKCFCSFGFQYTIKTNQNVSYILVLQRFRIFNDGSVLSVSKEYKTLST